MTVSVRYIVDDVDAAVDFYRDRLGSMSTCARPPGPLACAEPICASFSTRRVLAVQSPPVGSLSRADGTVSDRGRGPSRVRRATSRGRSLVPGRAGRGQGRPPNPGRGPRRQPDRVVPACGPPEPARPPVRTSTTTRWLLLARPDVPFRARKLAPPHDVRYSCSLVISEHGTPSTR
jgi:hypothetical protein